MKKTWKLTGLLASAFLVTVLFYACSKDNSTSSALPAGKQNVKLFLTDGPGFFDKVLIDIKSVKVLIDTCAASNPAHEDHWDHDGDEDHDKKDSCVVWDSLAIKPGIYNLLTLTNGTDTLLAGGNIPKGKIIMIKISLGTHNSLVKDSVSYPLNLPFGTNPWILVKLRGDEWDQYLPGHLQLWLDFDITRSIIKVRNGEFYLRPFIRIFTKVQSGGITGRVLPNDAFAVLSAYGTADTAYGLPGGDGRFLIRGLKPGTYSLFINASNGYQDSTISNIQVTNSGNVNLGTIQLHK